MNSVQMRQVLESIRTLGPHMNIEETNLIAIALHKATVRLLKESDKIEK